MKIDNSLANLEALTTQPTQAAEVRDGKRTGPSPASATDQLRLSPGVKLAANAAVAASQSSDVRPDVVARAKALLQSGEVGNDPGRLADALIDRALAQDE